jgi:hypothetical protein
MKSNFKDFYKQSLKENNTERETRLNVFKDLSKDKIFHVNGFDREL